jgi:hypothetical protein
MGPGLQSSLTRAVLAMIFTSAAMLQCTNALVMHRLPVAAERYYQEEGENAEGPEDYDSSYEDDLKRAIEKATGPQTVLLLSSLSGRMVYANGDGLRSDGAMQDPATRFVRTAVSYNTVTLSTQTSGGKHLLGIDSSGHHIVLDAANSSDIAHVFEMLSMDQFDEDMLGPVQLRAKVGSNYCYLAFDASNLPLHKTCTPEPTAKVSKTETFFSLVPM